MKNKYLFLVLAVLVIVGGILVFRQGGIDRSAGVAAISGTTLYKSVTKSLASQIVSGSVSANGFTPDQQRQLNNEKFSAQQAYSNFLGASATFGPKEPLPRLGWKIMCIHCFLGLSDCDTNWYNDPQVKAWCANPRNSILLP